VQVIHRSLTRIRTFVLPRTLSYVIVLLVQVDGPEIRRRRELSGFGLRRFADVAGLSPAALSRIERGQRTPHPETAALIATALGCAISDLTPIHPEDSDERDHGLALPDHQGARGAHP
jgi:transcriptional regulator with XRE-family HTH domain